MYEEIQLEMQSVKAIFSEEVQIESFKQLSIQCAPNVRVILSLPVDYPSAPPLFEICAPSVSGEKKRRLLKSLDFICREQKNESILYPLIETTIQFFEEEKWKNTNEKEEKSISTGTTDNFVENGELVSNKAEEAAFYSGQIIEDRKSAFQAHVIKINSKEQVPILLTQLKSIGKISKARHSPSAWRILMESKEGNSNQQQQKRQIEQHDCDDDGENGAGPKLLRLLVQMNALGILVVVSRWYGGIHLGPDRFRHICNAAREAIISGRFITDQNI